MTACPSCSSTQPDNARFCAECGDRLEAMACAACAAALLPGARFCNECGAPQGTAEPPTVAAVPRSVSSRRVTSVLFADLVGFTARSENRDHEDTRELLSRYFDECRRIIGRYDGTVEKFIGDAVMAVWGVPTAHEDDAERAVRAGLELVAMTAGIDAGSGEGGLGLRVGIVTGEVAVTIGAEHQGMVAGDAVNTASRVQSVADPGQVWVDETTRLLTSSAITYLDRGSHPLKGKKDPVPLWSVQAVIAGVGGDQRADGLEAPLVGRDRELRLVKEVFHAVEETRQPALFVMVGEPGHGKSRLGWEFEKYIDGLSATVKWHSGRCVAYGEGLAFFALAEAIRPRLRALVPQEASPTDDNAQDQGRLLELGLEKYVPDEVERDWLRPRIGALLGIGSVSTHPREDLFAAWTVFLERVGEEHPVVLLIDDAQHADDGLLLFVEHLLAAASFPCFVVLLGRPGLLDQHPSLATNHRATISHLAALNDRDVADLLDGLVVGLPDGVRGTLVTRSEGVPLFAVETVRSLIDRDLVIPRGGQYVLADPDALDLDSIGAPATLQALIAARLDALDPDQRRLVERGSVIGNVFAREEIADLCPELEDVDAVLAGLVRLQILSHLTSRFSAEYGQFQFVQSVVRQVAYSTLSRRDRRAIHLAVAAQTEAMEDSAGDLAPIVAEHYLSAVSALPSEPDVPELQGRAIAHLERAAVRARALGAPSAAVNHLLVALDLAPEPAVRARLDSAIAWAMVDSGDRVRARSHATAAVEAYDALGDVVAAGLAAAALGYSLALAGDNAAAVAVLDPRWDALEHLPHAESAQLALGKALVTAASRFGDARRDVVARRIQIAERVGDHGELAEALTALAVDFSAMGASLTAVVLLSAAAELARAEHHPSSLAKSLSNLTVEHIPEDLERAVAVGLEGVEVAGRSGVAVWHDYTLSNLLLAKFAAGQWDELAPLLPEGRRGTNVRCVTAGIEGFIHAARGESFDDLWGPEGGVPESDDPSDRAWVAFAQSQQALGEGRTDLALAGAAEATDIMLEYSGMSDDYVHFWPAAVDLALRAGETAEAERLVGAATEATERWRAPRAIYAHLDRFTGLMSRESDPEGAEQALRSAVAGFTAWGSPHYRARAQAELGRWLESLGRTAEAAPLLHDALTTLSDLRAHGWMAELGWPARIPAEDTAQPQQTTRS